MSFDRSTKENLVFFWNQSDVFCLFVHVAVATTSNTRQLQSGNPLLADISKEFYDYTLVELLAAELLDGIGHGGHAFLKRKTPPGVAFDPVLLAYSVLQEWVQERPGRSTHGALYHVLDKVCPVAAQRFKENLLG